MAEWDPEEEAEADHQFGFPGSSQDEASYDEDDVSAYMMHQDDDDEDEDSGESGDEVAEALADFQNARKKLAMTRKKVERGFQPRHGNGSGSSSPNRGRGKGGSHSEKERYQQMRRS